MNLQDALQKKMDRRKKKDAKDKVTLDKGAASGEAGDQVASATESKMPAEEAEKSAEDETMAKVEAAAERARQKAAQQEQMLLEASAAAQDKEEEAKEEDRLRVAEEAAAKAEQEAMAKVEAARERAMQKASEQEAKEKANAVAVLAAQEAVEKSAANVTEEEDEATTLARVTAELEAEEAALAEKEAVEKEARDKERIEKAATYKLKAEAAEKAKAETDAKREEEKAKRAETLAAKKAEMAQPKSPPGAAGEGGRPQLKKGGGKGARAAERSPTAALDNDLQAKLAARRERAETGAPPSAQGGASGGGRGSVDDLRAPVDTDLKAKLAARKARAEAPEIPSLTTPVPPATAGGGVSEDMGLEQGRNELVSFLAEVGELPAEHMLMGGGSEVGVMGESGEIFPEIDIGAMMIGHGTGLIGHGGGWGDEADTAAYGALDTYSLPPYHPAGLVGDPLLEEILRGTLKEGLGAGGGENELETALLEALAGETAAFDPVNEVPVNWGTAAAAAVGHELPGVDDGGGLFGMTIGTMEVDDQTVPGGVYLSEDALGALYDAGGAGGVKKVVGWDDGGGEGVGESGWRAAYPATGAQRRAMIAEREKEQHRQRQAAMELASVQRGQAQVEFAAYKGPPCGVGMALQAGTRMLMGTLRNHKRWVIQVDSLLPDGPAARCGKIIPGDVLLSVRDGADKVATQVNNRVEEAKAVIMGPPGSVVILRFTRGDTMHDHTHASFEVSLVRESVKHPPSLPVGEVGVEEELDWALLPEQTMVEPGDMPLSLEGVLLAQLSNEEMQMLLTGEEGKTAEMIVRKKDGSQARVNVLKTPVPRPAQQLKQMLHGTGREKPMPEQKFMGSRTLAKFASNLPAAPTGATLGAMVRPVSGSSDAGVGSSASGWFSKVGGKVGGLFARAAPSAPTGGSGDVHAAAAVRPLPASSPALTEATSSTGRDAAHVEAGEEWVMLNSPSKHGGAGVASRGGAGAWQASDSALRKLLEDKRLPADVLVPRLQKELGVQSCEDLGYLESQDITRLQLPTVLTRKLLEVVKDQKSSSQQPGSHPAPATPPAAAPAEEDKENNTAAQQQSTPTSAQLRAQQAQQFLQNREMQKRAREAELLKLQKSLHKPATPSVARPDESTATVAAVTAAAAEDTVAAAAVPKEECTAVATYEAAADHEVSIKAGETIKVVRKHPSGWWEGVTARGNAGWFPSTYISDVRPIQSSDSTTSQCIHTPTTPAPTTPSAATNSEQQTEAGESAPQGAGGGGEDGDEAPAGGEAGAVEEDTPAVDQPL